MSLFEASKKEKKMFELDIKKIIYPIEKKELQEQVITILRQFELSVYEIGLKRWLDKILYSTKHDYYDKVDFILKDIFEERLKRTEISSIKKLINELQQAAIGIKRSNDDLDTIFRGS